MNQVIKKKDAKVVVYLALIESNLGRKAVFDSHAFSFLNFIIYFQSSILRTMSAAGKGDDLALASSSHFGCGDDNIVRGDVNDPRARKRPRLVSASGALRRLPPREKKRARILQKVLWCSEFSGRNKKKYVLLPQKLQELFRLVISEKDDTIKKLRERLRGVDPAMRQPSLCPNLFGVMELPSGRFTAFVHKGSGATGNKKFLGEFENAIDAARARDLCMIEARGSSASSVKLNLPHDEKVAAALRSSSHFSSCRADQQRYKGVQRTEPHLFNASICRCGKRWRLGTFGSPEEASMAHNEVARALGMRAGSTVAWTDVEAAQSTRIAAAMKELAAIRRQEGKASK